MEKDYEEVGIETAEGCSIDATAIFVLRLFDRHKTKKEQGNNMLPDFPGKTPRVAVIDARFGPWHFPLRGGMAIGGLEGRLNFKFFEPTFGNTKETVYFQPRRRRGGGTLGLLCNSFFFEIF